MCICLYHRHLMLLIRYLWFKILSTNNLTTEYLCTTVKFAKISLTLKFSITNALKYKMNFMKNCTLLSKRGNLSSQIFKTTISCKNSNTGFIIICMLAVYKVCSSFSKNCFYNTTCVLILNS